MFKVAIIGAGQIADTVHIPTYMERNDVEVVAVVDNNLSRAKELADKWKIKNIYADSKEMYKMHNIDITSICTPNRFHYENVMEALANMSHVLCEKPPALQSWQALEMHEFAIKQNKCLYFDFQNRFSSENIFMQNNISKLGKIQKIEAIALRRSGVPGWGNFIDKETQGGGPLIDYGIHSLDLALSYVESLEIDHVYAYTLNGIGQRKDEGFFGKWDPSKYTVEDSLFGIVCFKNGQIIDLKTSFIYQMKEKKDFNIKLFGTEGGSSLFPLEIYKDVKGELSIEKNMFNNVNPHTLLFDDFINICKNISDYNYKESYRGYIIQKIVEMMYLSSEKKRMIYENN